MPDFSKPMLSAATATLTPHGLVRWPKPRVFVDDQGWYGIVVGLQSHKHRPVGLLDVGVDFHWFARDYFAYHLGARVTDPERAPHGEFDLGAKTPAAVKVKVQAMVDCALERVLALRRSLAELASAREAIVGAVTPGDPWSLYDAGLIEGLAGNPIAAAAHFQALTAIRHEAPWFDTLKARVRAIEPLLQNGAELKGHLGAIIEEARRMKGLASWGGAL